MADDDVRDLHDLVIRGGRVVDPSRRFDAIADVGFRDGLVSAIGTGLRGREVRDAVGRIVTPGLIDLHTHVYWGGTALGVDPLPLARAGCTTLVDAGSAGPGNFQGFLHHVIRPAPVRILAFLNISFGGIFGFSRRVMVGECENVRLLSPADVVDVARSHADTITGVKVRVGLMTSGVAGIQPLEIAREAAEELELPLMVHVDFPPPTLAEILARLRPGDILTHCYRSFPNSPVSATGDVKKVVLDARDRGVLFDIGHGMGAFSFVTARSMLARGFLPDCISSDVHSLSVDGPAFDLQTTLSKFLCLGADLGDVIRAATEGPALAMHRPDLGTLRIGSRGDASILSIDEGEFRYVDSVGETLVGGLRLAAHGIVVGGTWWSGGTADSGGGRS